MARRCCGTRPAAARRAARLASHREAAAQYERALRFAAGADPATLAGLHEGLADEVALLDRWDDAETAGERALALWREAGDRLREGDALRRLSRIRWNMCRGREAVAAAEAAVSVLEPLGPSVELARAYATFANQRMLHADYDVAIDLALRAQALAIRFGATDVHSDALNTQAASRSAQGLDWAGQMRRALDIALAGGHHHRGRARLHQPVRNPRRQAGVRRGRAVPGAGNRVLRRARHHHLRDLHPRREGQHAGTHRPLGRSRRAEHADPDRRRPVPGEPALLADPARRDPGPAGRARGLGIPRRGGHHGRRGRRAAAAGTGPAGPRRGALARRQAGRGPARGRAGPRRVRHSQRLASRRGRGLATPPRAPRARCGES